MERWGETGRLRRCFSRMELALSAFRVVVAAGLRGVGEWDDQV